MNEAQFMRQNYSSNLESVLEKSWVKWLPQMICLYLRKALRACLCWKSQAARSGDHQRISELNISVHPIKLFLRYFFSSSDNKCDRFFVSEPAEIGNILSKVLFEEIGRTERHITRICHQIYNIWRKEKKIYKWLFQASWDRKYLIRIWWTGACSECEGEAVREREGWKAQSDSNDCLKWAYRKRNVWNSASGGCMNMIPSRSCLKSPLN